jgi:hypothetical protein
VVSACRQTPTSLLRTLLLNGLVLDFNCCKNSAPSLNTGYFVWFHSIDPTECELEVYDFTLQEPFAVCIFGIILYSDSCPCTPSGNFLAQPEFISFHMVLSDDSFRFSSLYHTEQQE